MHEGRVEPTGLQVALDSPPVVAPPAIQDGEEIQDLVGPFHRLQDLQGGGVVVQGAESDGGVVVLVRPQESDRPLVLAVSDGLQALHIGCVHDGGMDGVLLQAFPVQVEVEPDRPETRIETFADMAVGGEFLKPLLPKVGLPDRGHLRVLLLLLPAQDPIFPDERVQHRPVFRIVAGKQADLRGCLLLPGLVQADMETVSADGVPPVLQETLEVVRNAFRPSHGQFPVMLVRAFRRAGGRDDDGVQVEVPVLEEAPQVALDAGHLLPVVAGLLPDFGAALLEVDVAGRVGLDPAFDDDGLVSDGVIAEAADGTDIEGQGIGPGYPVDPAVLLEDVARQQDGRLAERGPHVDGLHVVVEDVPVGAHDDRVQPEPFRDDGRFHVLAEHVVLAADLPPVPAHDQLVGVVRQRLLFGNPVMGPEFFVGDGCRVGLVPVDVRQVPPQEHLQLEAVDEVRGIGRDGIEEPPVMFVSLQLRLPVALARNQDRVQPEAVLRHEKIRIETELPVPVLHRFRYDDPEVEVHLAAPFRHVAEAGRNPGRLDDIRGDHLSVLVLDGPHDQHFVPVRVFHDHRVPAGFPAHRDLRQFLLVGDDHLGAQGLAAEPLQFPLGATAGDEEGSQQDRTSQPHMHGTIGIFGVVRDRRREGGWSRAGPGFPSRCARRRRPS